MSETNNNPATPLQHPNAELLESATKGFDFLFSNDLAGARAHFAKGDDPFHLMGLGVCAFLEAALGMETGLMSEASRCLAASEAGARKEMRVAKPRDIKYMSRFPHGLEWEILNADAVVLLGMTHALSESYIGYAQCMLSLNNAHSKFTKLYKTVFPNGLPSNEPISPIKSAHLKSVSHQPSISSLASASSIASAATATGPSSILKPSGSFFSRWMSGSAAAASTPILPHEQGAVEDGPVEELIVSGTAFGFGLFNLVFSLLPKKVQGVVGFFGYKSDRNLALKALALAASKDDVHSVFSGLVLMTYHGVVLLLSGYQADEKRLLREYKALVDKIEKRYPEGALWILNRAKIMRMSYDAEGAIDVLKDGLKPDRTHSFAQADMLLIFELAWTLLSQRRYQEAADTFLKITEMNSWSHGTYYFIAAGCYISLGNITKAQELFDAIPELIEKKKMTGKDLPTEVFIKKKLAFYKEKHARRGGDPAKWAECVKISPAEEIGIFWNNHARILPQIAQQHIDELVKLTPHPSGLPISPLSPTKTLKSPIVTGMGSLSLKSPTQTSISSPTRSPSTSIDATSPTTPTHPTQPQPQPSPSTPSSASASASSSTSTSASTLLDLDTTDEIAIRALLLGINYRVVGQYDLARMHLVEAEGMQNRIAVSTWVGGVVAFEMAVLELKEMEGKMRMRGVGAGAGVGVGAGASAGVGSGAISNTGSSAASSTNSLSVSVSDDTSVTSTTIDADADDDDDDENAQEPEMTSELRAGWGVALKAASQKLDVALSLAGSHIDLSSRLDSRIAMLRDEIGKKGDRVGVVIARG